MKKMKHLSLISNCYCLYCLFLFLEESFLPSFPRIGYLPIAQRLSFSISEVLEIMQRVTYPAPSMNLL